MSRKRLVFTVGGTALCALGAGFFMQMGGAGTSAAVMAQPSPVQQSVVAPSELANPDERATPDIGAIALIAAQPDLQAPKAMPAPDLENAGDRTRAQADCGVKARAEPAAMASVDLSVSAPCFGNERVTIHHSGMIFTDTTDDSGSLTLNIPALSERAVFIVAFATGKGAVATAQVAGLDSVDRVVLQWSGHSGFELHALEPGASYGDPGHVWFGSDPGKTGTGSMRRLGDADMLAPQMAEIYSFPAGASPTSGTVALSVEAEVTDANCGRDIAAQSLELRAGSGLHTRDLVLSVPECSARGDFLVLNYLFDDLKIAAK
ncbi:MAG: hypothetical protein ACK5MY_13030 [Jhaorihella sp.]